MWVCACVRDVVCVDEWCVRWVLVDVMCVSV